MKEQRVEYNKEEEVENKYVNVCALKHLAFKCSSHKYSIIDYSQQLPIQYIVFDIVPPQYPIQYITFDIVYNQYPIQYIVLDNVLCNEPIKLF